MKVDKRLGIWMDHASANLMEFTVDPIDTTTIVSTFSHDGTETLGKSEKLINNKEKHEEAAYYKKLGEVIRHYDDVILFGPTEAKAELLNTLKGDHLFENIRIETQQADKMTENQQHAFVKAYFKRH